MSTNPQKQIKVGDKIRAPKDIEAYVSKNDVNIPNVMGHPDFAEVQSIWDGGRKATIGVGNHYVSVHVDKL
jgi:hypothetical protein